MSADTTVAGVEPATVSRELLERCGSVYGSLGLAIAFTDSRHGEGTKIARGWKTTRPLASPEVGRSIMGRTLAANPIVVLGASNLIGVDVDGDPGRELIRALGLDFPTTVTVRTGAGGHCWFRPPPGCPDGVVKIQLAETVTVSSDGYFVVPPARHPSGRLYAFVEGRAPWDVEIATLPLKTVKRIVAASRRDERDLREQLASEPDCKVPVGSRRALVFRLASMCRRWTASEQAIVEMCWAWNQAMCSPPLTRDQVRAQVSGAMKMSGGQEVAVTRLRDLVEQATRR